MVPDLELDSAASTSEREKRDDSKPNPLVARMSRAHAWAIAIAAQGSTSVHRLTCINCQGQESTWFLPIHYVDYGAS